MSADDVYNEELRVFAGSRFSLMLALCLSANIWTAPASGQAPAPAPAPERQEAREIDRRARETFAAGDYPQAARLFERANRLAPHPATQFNVGLAWDRAGELARAADAYETALGTQGLGDEMASAARDRLATLKKNLGYLVISAPIGGTVSVAHAENLPIPAKIHVVPGMHTVRIRRSSGTISSQEVRVLAGATETVDAPAAGTSEAPPSVERATRAKKSSASEPRERPPSGGSVRPVVGWIAVGTGAALGIAAGILGFEVLARRQDCLDTNVKSDCDKARRYRLWTNLAAGAAVVSGGVGLYLVLGGSNDGDGGVARRELGARIAF